MYKRGKTAYTLNRARNNVCLEVEGHLQESIEQTSLEYGGEPLSVASMVTLISGVVS